LAVKLEGVHFGDSKIKIILRRLSQSLVVKTTGTPGNLEIACAILRKSTEKAPRLGIGMSRNQPYKLKVNPKEPKVDTGRLEQTLFRNLK